MHQQVQHEDIFRNESPTTLYKPILQRSNTTCPEKPFTMANQNWKNIKVKKKKNTPKCHQTFDQLTPLCI